MGALISTSPPPVQPVKKIGVAPVVQQVLTKVCLPHIYVDRCDLLPNAVLVVTLSSQRLSLVDVGKTQEEHTRAFEHALKKAGYMVTEVQIDTVQPRMRLEDRLEYL
jgi:hypothetical protein